VLKYVAELCEKPLDVHLMVVEPMNYLPAVKDLGAKIMNVHYEACAHLHRAVTQIKDAGMMAGVTLNPSTPVHLLKDIIHELDLVLLMSVNPGFGGQKFIPHTVNKVRELRELIDSTGSKALIEVDGGVNVETGKLLAAAGSDALVAGNAVFKDTDPHAVISALRAL
jgi:ribulose-phosphate 3-epimerase